jgi:hypothetical protein
MADPLAMIDDRIRDLEERLDELRTLRDEMAGTDSGKAEAPVTGADDQEDESDDELEDEPEDEPEDRPPTPRLMPEWAANVPSTDEGRVAAVREAIGSTPKAYMSILHALPGWRTVDLAGVLKDHPETFRPSYDQAGHKAWELGAATDRPESAMVTPPGGLEARCRVIAEVLKDGPLMPHAIQARLRWPPNYVGSTLSRQQKLPTPWFLNTQPGWTLTELARKQLAG